MGKWLPIIGALMTAINAWIIVFFNRHLDKKAVANVGTVSSPPDVDAKSRLMRRLRWFIGLSLAFPALLVVCLISFAEFGRASLLITFVLTVESFVGFTMFYVMYAQIIFATDFATGLAKGFEKVDAGIKK